MKYKYPREYIYMARKIKRTNRRKNNNRDSDITRFHFTQLLESNLVSAASKTSLNPSVIGVSGRLAATADGFELYRLRRVRYRLLPPTVTPSSSTVACYLAGIVDTTINSAVLLSQCAHHVTLAPREIVPTRWVTVPKIALASYGSWYKTVVGTPDPSEEDQGFLYVTGGTSDGYILDLEIDYEFKTACAIGSTPAIRLAKEIETERSRLLKILGFGSQLLPPNPAPAPAAIRTMV